MLPIATSLALAWLDDFAPGAGAPTAFSLLIILTCPFGAIIGAALGWNVAQPLDEPPNDGAELAETNRSAGLDSQPPEPSDSLLLVEENLHWFDRGLQGKPAGEAAAARAAYVEHAVRAYKRLVARQIPWLAVWTVCGLLVLPLIVVAVPHWMWIGRQVIGMRRLFPTALARWSIEPRDQDESLPWSLRTGGR